MLSQDGSEITSFPPGHMGDSTNTSLHEESLHTLRKIEPNPDRNNRQDQNYWLQVQPEQRIEI